MQNKVLVIIDVQNNITPNYKLIVKNLNEAIDWALENEIFVCYIKHHNIAPDATIFVPGSNGAELVPELKIVSENIFVKTEVDVVTSKFFMDFLEQNKINEVFVTGADATACVKAACSSLKKSGFDVHVISDCVTSYDLSKLDEMFSFYKRAGCDVKCLEELCRRNK